MICMISHFFWNLFNCTENMQWTNGYWIIAWIDGRIDRLVDGLTDFIVHRSGSSFSSVLPQQIIKPWKRNNKRAENEIIPQHSSFAITACVALGIKVKLVKNPHISVWTSCIVKYVSEWFTFPATLTSLESIFLSFTYVIFPHQAVRSNCYMLSTRPLYAISSFLIKNIIWVFVKFRFGSMIVLKMGHYFHRRVVQFNRGDAKMPGWVSLLAVWH